MPAGPIGDCWESGSWEDTAWEDGSWGDGDAALGLADAASTWTALRRVTEWTALLILVVQYGA